MTHALFLETSRFLAQAFFAGLWQGAVLIATVALVLRFASGLSAAVRHAIWGLAFALGILLPFVHVPVHKIVVSAAMPARLHVGIAWGITIAAVWLALMLYRGIRLLLETMRVHRVWKRAVPVAAPDAVEEALRCSPVSASLCTSEDVVAPCVIGFFAPRLLIPASVFAELAPSELAQIVLHETEHLRRRDDWLNLLQKIGLVFFPLNPALLWMDRRLSLERELACDAGVIASTQLPFDYARCLARLAEHGMLHRGIALSLSAWGRRPELVQRVQHLIRPSVHWSGWRARLSTAVACLTLGVLGVGLAASPRMLSFTDTMAPETAASAALPVAPEPEFKITPVVYHPATHLSAPTPTTTHRTRARVPVAHHVELRSVRDTMVHKQQPHLLLTDFPIEKHRQHVAPMPPPIQPVSAYAAVRFDNGWLILQL